MLESRKQGYGFAGDEQIAEERNALEQEIKSAKDAAERRRERYINSIPDLPDFEGVSSSGDGKIYISELEHPEYLSYATDEEKKIYTYLKNKEGTESANSYLKHLEPELTARKGKETGQAVLDGGALMYLPYAAYAGLEQFTGGVEQLLSKNAVPTTATRHASQYISDNAKGVGKLAYDVTSSIANMAPSVALGTLNPALGSAAMFGSVYGNSYNSALHEGKDRGEAQTYATLRAVSETALQNILGGTSALGGKMPEALVGSIKNINNAAYRIAAKYGKSILSEGSEEYLQKILQPVIRNLAFGEDNKFRVISEDAAYAGLMGALTAGVFETGNIVRGENWDNTPPPVTINKNPIIQDILKTENNVGELAKPYPKENLPKEVAEWIRKLPQYKDAIEISSTPSHEQISLLSRQEGVEFASITIGNRNIIIRGDTSGTPISQDLLEDMIRNKGVLNCHSHPYIGDFRPSESDLYIAHILSHQEEFEIITPDNMRAVYTKHGIKSVGNIERKLSEQDVLELYKLFGG